MHEFDSKYSIPSDSFILSLFSVETNNVSYLSPQTKLPSPIRENMNIKVRRKREEFMSDSGLNESMDDKFMAEI